METLPVNWLAIIVAAAVKFLLGWAWYAPPVMGRQWQAMVGLGEEQLKKGMARAIPIDLVANLVMAYVLARIIAYAGASTIGEGALIGFMAWIGFVAAVTVGATFYEQRPFKLFLITNAYLLVGLVIMGAILGAWQDAPVAAPA